MKGSTLKVFQMSVSGRRTGRNGEPCDVTKMRTPRFLEFGHAEASLKQSVVRSELNEGFSEV